jgi:hypothetical protein
MNAAATAFGLHPRTRMEGVDRKQRTIRFASFLPIVVRPSHLKVTDTLTLNPSDKEVFHVTNAKIAACKVRGCTVSNLYTQHMKRMPMKGIRLFNLKRAINFEKSYEEIFA